MNRLLSFLGGIVHTVLWYQGVLEGDTIKYVGGIIFVIIFVIINVLCE